MSVFVAVARTGSLSAAARHLSMPLTTISRQLSSLETHVGTALITRTTRHLSMTAAGKTYLDVCTRVLEDIEGAESQLARTTGTLSGDLDVTAPIVFGRLHALPVIGEFLDAHPLVNCRLTLDDRNVDLARDGVDVAIRIGPLASSSLIASKVGTLRLVTCAAPGYLKRHGSPERPGDLSEHSCIAFSSLAGSETWSFKSTIHGRNVVRIRRRFSTNTAEAAIDAAVAGLGITRVLSYQAASAIARDRLRVILYDFDDVAIPIHCIHRAVRLAKPQVKSFAAFASASLRKRLARIGSPD